MGLPTVKVVAATLETIHNISNVKGNDTKIDILIGGDYYYEIVTNDLTQTPLNVIFRQIVSRLTWNVATA